MHVSLSDKIFQKRRHCVTVKGQVQGRFDSAELEDAIKEIVVKQGEDILTSGVQVRVCDEQGDRRHGSTHQLPLATRPRTTAPHDQDRATPAASSFFDPIAIGDFQESFVDGATGANNPVYEVWNEARSDHYEQRPGDLGENMPRKRGNGHKDNCIVFA
jgi:hypothetical protein